MSTKLQELVAKYLARTAKASAVLQRHLGVSPMDWRSHGHAQIGETEEGIRYYFHGIGVAVHLPDGVIDFDFGEGGRVDGFSPWKLAQFAEQLGQEFVEFQSWRYVETLLAEAESRGEVKRLFVHRQDDLFYLHKDG